MWRRAIPFVAQFLDEDQRIQPNEIMLSSAKVMLDELHRLSVAPRPVRDAARPHWPALTTRPPDED